MAKIKPKTILTFEQLDELKNYLKDTDLSFESTLKNKFNHEYNKIKMSMRNDFDFQNFMIELECYFTSQTKLDQCQSTNIWTNKG
jgi:hypothetical protein